MATDKKRDTVPYWDARLNRMGLGMESGHVDWITYGHRVSERDFDGRRTYGPEVTGESLDVSEWPVSLL